MSLDDAGFDTGARLKAARAMRQMSQRQLAVAAGVTGSMISLIEQNRTSPSVATLKKILAGLGMSLGDFFAETADLPGQWHFPRGSLRDISPETRAGAGPHVTLLQVGRPGASPLQMLHEHYPAGADTGPELYSHEGDEAGIVVAGEILVTVGSETRRLKCGDAYLFNSRIAHRFHNPGPEDCIVVSACTPPTF